MGRWWDVTLALALAITSAVESAVYERRRCVGIVSSQRCAISIAGVSASGVWRRIVNAAGNRVRCRAALGLGECGPAERWRGRRRV
ncbi:hypothetical protein B0H14DRAFT_2892700 [Mycena olivaceomarginata]|nr:hypothetical protein B0H14DRAFT_2892700 [Mycena olivaceomarginata]